MRRQVLTVALMLMAVGLVILWTVVLSLIG